MINYYEYIQSPAWELKTEEIRKRGKGECECCKLRWGYAVHHRSYERLGDELDHHLIHLCDECHKMIHDIEPIGKFFIWPSRLPFLIELKTEATHERNKNNVVGSTPF